LETCQGGGSDERGVHPVKKKKKEKKKKKKDFLKEGKGFAKTNENGGRW